MRAFSASRTARSSGILPSSLKYTPTPRLTLVVRESALKASFRPRIGSRGASSTAEKRDMIYRREVKFGTGGRDGKSADRALPSGCEADLEEPTKLRPIDENPSSAL